MVDYLVKSLGFSKEKAIITSSKESVSRFKSTENLDFIVDYLRQSGGLTETQIKNAIFSSPKILSHKFDETLKPKLKLFQDLGFSGFDLARFISINRRLWGLSLNAHILPAIELLKTCLTSEDHLLKALKKSPWFLGNSVLKFVPLNVALLQSYGFSASQIEELLLAVPRYFVMEPKSLLQDVLTQVEEILQVPLDSHLFFKVVCVLALLSEDSLELKSHQFLRYGWTQSDVLWLAYTNPKCLSFSENTIRSKLSFFVKDLGCNPAQIAARPIVLNYSIEKRVIPRSVVFNVLKEKGLIKSTYSLFSCLTLSESQFLERFLLPFKEEVYTLNENHRKSIGSPWRAAK